MEKARRRHVPAFGDWNYYSASSSPDEPPHFGATAAESWWYAPEPEACSDAWFRYSPPPRRRPPAPKKARRPETAGGGVAVAVPAEHKSVATETNRATAVARAAKGARRVVVRPVDEDLYTWCRRRTTIPLSPAFQGGGRGLRGGACGWVAWASTASPEAS